MSDVMLLGVLRMPIDASDPFAMAQFVGRARQAASRIEADAVEIARLRAELDVAVAAERERWRALLEERAAGCERAAENCEDPKFDAMARVLMSVREQGSKA